MEEAAAPSKPAGRNVLVPRSESADIGGPFSCSSGHRGRGAKRGVQSAIARSPECNPQSAQGLP
eukprot:3368258-Alexandrium_andersonii.AAC.1